MHLIGNGTNEQKPSPELQAKLRAFNEQLQRELGDGNFIIVLKTKGNMSGGVCAQCSDIELHTSIPAMLNPMTYHAPSVALKPVRIARQLNP
jgi:hypothetical protein